MFRVTEDPSSGRLVQYLAKITRMFLLCPLTPYMGSASAFLYSELHTGQNMLP